VGGKDLGTADNGGRRREFGFRVPELTPKGTSYQADLLGRAADSGWRLYSTREPGYTHLAGPVKVQESLSEPPYAKGDGAA
jgi:hypothetical protein